MRLMTWCLGVLVLFAQRGDMVACGHAVAWQWYTMLTIWWFVGLVALTVAVVRLVSGRLKAGTLTMPGVARPVVPAEKDED
jgi:hypothetical protein